MAQGATSGCSQQDLKASKRAYSLLTRVGTLLELLLLRRSLRSRQSSEWGAVRPGPVDNEVAVRSYARWSHTSGRYTLVDKVIYRTRPSPNRDPQEFVTAVHGDNLRTAGVFLSLRAETLCASPVLEDRMSVSAAALLLCTCELMVVCSSWHLYTRSLSIEARHPPCHSISCFGAACAAPRGARGSACAEHLSSRRRSANVRRRHAASRVASSQHACLVVCCRPSAHYLL